jgi:nucleoside-diphosphate-sugar epimerase
VRTLVTGAGGFVGSHLLDAEQLTPVAGDLCLDVVGVVGRLVFAASVTQLAAKIDQIMVSGADLAAKAPFAPISITGGVLADDAMKLFH